MFYFANKISMMRVIFLFTVFLFYSNSIFSQINITQQELMRIFSPSNLIYNYDGGEGTIDIGKINGPNVYDFSNLSFQDSIIITNYQVSQIPILAQRYNHNATTLGEGAQNLVENPIILQSNDSTYFIGEATISDEYVFAYYNPYELFAKFPLTFNPPHSSFSQWIGVLDTTYDLNWQIQSVDNHNNLVDVWIDGYGTLLLPGLSLECLRMKRSESYWNEKSFLYLTREGLMFIVDNVLNSSPDSGIVNGYYYFFKSSAFVSVDEKETTQIDFKLYQNYPNPFNPSTRIQYQVSSTSQVTLKVYDVLGNKTATLVNEEKPAGNYEAEFSPVSSISHPASGIYFCRLQTENYSKTIKMLYLK